jgi:beta-barrel assembly-enhancing protease
MTRAQTWRGQALYFDAHATDTTTVVATISPDGILIENLTPPLFFPFSQLKITSARGSYVRIEMRNSSGSVLSIQNIDALKALEAHHQLRGGILGRLSHNNQVLIASGLFVVVAILFFTLGLNALADIAANMIPVELEKKLGDSVAESMVAGTTVSSDPATLHVLEKCAALVQKFDDTGRNVRYTITLVEDAKTKNAFALPGGAIVVYSGLLALMDNEAEFFGVLAHEVGHVVKRHGMRRIARGAMVGLISSVVLGDTKGIAAILISNGQQLVTLSYDRDEELEADQFALRALQREGIDARGMVTLFENLKRSEGSDGWLTFLSTHPDLDERLKILSREIENLNSPSKRTLLTPAEWNTLTKRDEANRH